MRVTAGATGWGAHDMGELWQAYGNWIIYAVIVLGMLWMHGGLGRRTAQGGPHGHEQGGAGAHGHEQEHVQQDPQSTMASSAVSPAIPQDRKGHNHGKGCC